MTALADALFEILLESQYRGSYAAAQSDIRRATAAYLSELGADRSILQAVGEEQEDFRSRVLTLEAGGTLEAIRLAVNAVLSRYTTSTCQVIETPLDRWFVGDGSENWHGCVGDGISPSYPDRLYESESSRNEGDSIEGCEPLGARVFGDALGREFMVLVPDISIEPTYVMAIGEWYVGSPLVWHPSDFEEEAASITDVGGGVWDVAASVAGGGTVAHYIHWTDSADPIDIESIGTIDLVVEAKANGLNELRLYSSMPTSPYEVYAFFVLTSGGSVGSESNGTGSVTDLGDGWVECRLSLPVPISVIQFRIDLADTSETLSFVGDDSSGVLLRSVSVETETPQNHAGATIQGASSTALAVYRQVETVVNHLIGHSMRWIMQSSPHLP
jgi:hypothetical protein